MAVRIGAIGIGGIAQQELNHLDGMDVVDIVAGADVSPGARELFEAEFDATAYDDYRAFLDAHAGDLHGVLVATPHAYHYEQARACLEAGLHVLVEKPLTIDVEDAVSLVELAHRRDRILQVGYQRRFHPAFRTMKSLVDSGRIGDIHTVVGYIGQDWINPHRGTWRVDPEISGGGQLYDTGSHLLDALAWIVGGTPERVSASMDYAVPGVDVSAALTLTSRRNGTPTTASVAVTGDGVSMDPREGYVVWGTRGSMTYTDKQLVLEHKGANRYTIEDGLLTDHEATTRSKMHHFVDAIAGRAAPLATGAESVQVVALTEAAYLAAAEGRSVDVQGLIPEGETRRPRA